MSRDVWELHQLSKLIAYDILTKVTWKKKIIWLIFQLFKIILLVMRNVS